MRKALMDAFVARANINHYLSVLDSVDLTPQTRAMITGLLGAEMDKLSRDPKQLRFVEEKFVISQHRLDHLTRLRYGFPQGSTGRENAEKALADYRVTHRLTERLVLRMRQASPGPRQGRK